jgi:hypothetical protein
MRRRLLPRLPNQPPQLPRPHPPASSCPLPKTCRGGANSHPSLRKKPVFHWERHRWWAFGEFKTGSGFFATLRETHWFQGNTDFPRAQRCIATRLIPRKAAKTRSKLSEAVPRRTVPPNAVPKSLRNGPVFSRRSRQEPGFLNTWFRYRRRACFLKNTRQFRRHLRFPENSWHAVPFRQAKTPVEMGCQGPKPRVLKTFRK